MPGPEDAAIFDSGSKANATVDNGFSGVVGSVRVLPGYAGTITQDKYLKVRANLFLDGGSKTGWTFVEDKPSALTVGGDLIVGSKGNLTCSRSSTEGEGRGREITVGGNLKVLGHISADGKGFADGPGSPAFTVPKEKVAAPNESDYGTFAMSSLQSQSIPVSPAGPGHGGRGAGTYKNPYAWDTVQPHAHYGYLPLGSGIWKFPGGGTYGSITAPTSLGSGSRAFNPPDHKYSPWDGQDEFWIGQGVYGGGAVKLSVSGDTLVSGTITAEGARLGDTGASGGSIFLTTRTLSGDGAISVNGSDATGIAESRGGGGGGRLAVILTGGTSRGEVRLQAFGGEGRWSPNAAAGTIYLETAKDKAGCGTLIVDNNNKPNRSMYDICTSISDKETTNYSFGGIVVKGRGILYIGNGQTVTASSVSGDSGNLVIEGKFSVGGEMKGLASRESVSPQDEITRKLGPKVEVLTFGMAPTMRNEFLTRSCQISVYPYQNKIGVAADLSTYAYPDEVKAVKSATAYVISRKSGKQIARIGLRFNNRRYAEKFVTLRSLPDGNYSVRVVLDNGDKTAPMEFKRETFPWERNTLGVTDEVYAPFEPVRIDGDSIRLSSDRRYKMNGFGLFDKIVSQGREISAGPMTLKLETASGQMTEWKFSEAKFSRVAQNVAVYEAEADAGLLKVKTKSSTEFDGCTRVEMDILPGSEQGLVSRMWLEIPLKDDEMPLFHALLSAGVRWNYAGKTPGGGKIVWEPSEAKWTERRAPVWSIAPGTEGQNDGVVWDSTNMRCMLFFTVNPFVHYVWLGGAERGLAWFADSDKDWIPDMKKPAQVITREGGKLVMRVYLINKPSEIREAKHIVFGLQASPTKPLMPDWRRTDRWASWGYMTPAFGRFCCTKYPLGRDFSLVDKSIENRKIVAAGGKPDIKFLYDKVDELEAKGWPDSMTPQNWTAYWAQAAAQGPLDSIYYEEHWTDPAQTDVDTFGNEWSARQFLGAWPIREKNRIVYDSPFMTETNRTGRFISGCYTDSLVDFSVYYANEFMKRGISLYFDNTYPHLSMDPEKSDAHMTEIGKIQPANGIWAQRDYYKRIWNLLNYYNRKGMTPELRFSLHYTNSLILPWHTFATTNLDLEWSWKDPKDMNASLPYPPEMLLAETVARQIGTPTHVHSPLAGSISNPRLENGMGMVHEIPNRREGPFWKLLQDFGYGKDDVRHINYWADDTSPFKVSNNDVKWLGLVRNGDPFGMILLQSYSKSPTSAKLTLEGCKTWRDAETGEVLPSGSDGSVEVSFGEGYGTRLLCGSGTIRDDR